VTILRSPVQGSAAIIVSSLNISAFFFYEIFDYIRVTILRSPMQGSAAIVISSLNFSAYFYWNKTLLRCEFLENND
jgi:hypothetical protein